MMRKLHGRLRVAAGLLAGLSLLVGCGEGTGVPPTLPTAVSSGGASGPGQANGSTAVLDRLWDDARERVAHRGTKVVEILRETGAWERSREEILTDGDGHWAFKHVDALTATDPPEPTYGDMKTRRSAFHYRYEGFLVRGQAAFAQNWRVQDLGIGQVVAGRTCLGVEVRRTNAPEADHYVLHLDELNGLILHEERRTHTGTLVERRYYESIDLSPDLTNITFHTPVTDEVDLDPTQDLDAQMGFLVRAPRALPQGYRPYEVQSVDLLASSGVGSTGLGAGPWIKIVYTDGVDPILFLQRPVAQNYGVPSGVPFDQASSLPAFERGQPIPAGDKVLVDHSGTYLFAATEISGRETLLMGRLAQDELLDVVESTL